MQARFRKGTLTDAEKIRDFQVAMALETEEMHLDSKTCLLGVHHVLKNPQIGSYYICEVNDRVCGSLLLLSEWSDWRNGEVWWIHSLFIEPDFRGHKLFSQFYAFIQKLARDDESVRGLRLYVDKRNLHARKVYSKLGMSAEHYELFEWMK